MMATTDILLIRALGYEGNSLPQGLLCLQSFLRKHGYRSRIWDRYVNQSIPLLRKALRNVPVVGISAMSIQSADAIHLSRLIRSWYPRIKIIVGGVHFTALPHAAAEIADNVIVGEGELAIKDYLDSGGHTESIITREPIEHLDDIPPFTMVDLAPLVRTREHFHIVTGRGCPYQCNFCLSKDQRPAGVRHHSVDYVVSYMKDIVTHFGIRSFNIVDDIFVLNSRRVYALCDAIEKQIEEALTLSCFTHSGHGSRDLYARMSQVGFNRISMGIEHGNDRLLDFCGKRTTKRVIEETCDQISQAGIETNLTYILGNATETNETVTETVDFAIALHKRFNASSWFSFAEPLPGSELFKTATEYGVLLDTNVQSYTNLHPVFLPFGVSRTHLVGEHARGSLLANQKQQVSRRDRIKKKLGGFRHRIKDSALNRELRRVQSIVGPVVADTSQLPHRTV